MRASIGRFAVVLFVLSAGCSHVVRAPLEKEITDHVDAEKPWIQVEGLTDRCGAQRVVEGYAWVTTESVQVYASRPERVEGAWRWDPPAAASLLRGEVDRVHVRRFSLLKTSILVLSPIAFLIGAFAVSGVEGY